MIPRPSHPSIIEIMLGDRISKFIDRMNKIIRCVNRFKDWSVIMYDLEKVKMLKDTNKTVDMKRVPV